MSLIHIRMIRTKIDEETVLYSVESLDFSDESAWLEVGEIRLMRKERKYNFTPTKLWVDSKVLPPEIYALSDTDRKAIIAQEYSAFGWGGWSMTINGYAKMFLEKDHFPERHPQIFF